MEQEKKYNRKTTGTTISIFYEHYQLDKYNFNPPYQRDYNVWSEPQKAFLMDTIMKNFPMPPIFLEQKIDTSNGKTSYDVIDGKQRLLAIIEFINGNLALPDSFGNDIYGDERLNGKKLLEIMELAKSEKDLQTYLSNFWSYVINIEYIENPDDKIVDNIFDRLNRGGERLNEQELRKANYYDTIMYKDINSMRDNEFISNMLKSLNKNRLADLSFITEIYLMIKLNKIIDGTEQKIDEYFAEIVDTITVEESKEIVDTINKLINIISRFDLDYEHLKISGVSHLYAIWYLAFFIYKSGIEIDKKLIGKINEFYDDLRGERINQNTIEYHKSMQSASKYKYSRKKRIISILNYLDFYYDENEL